MWRYGVKASVAALKLGIWFVSIAACFAACYFLCVMLGEEQMQARVMHCCFAYAFALYLILALNMLLIDPLYGRSASNILSWLDYSQLEMRRYIRQSTNFVPLKTLYLYANGWRRGYISSKDAFNNIIGNILAMSPLSLMLPVLFKSMRKPSHCLCCIFVFISAIELLQLALMTGVCDIDDLLLNMLGAFLSSFVFNKPSVKRWMKRHFFVSY
ncbi:MAG: VanZ family protein [Eubacteriaceae bacterium]|nr:VanZ family protein [Eubacteriaceae bacterium]